MRNKKIYILLVYNIELCYHKISPCLVLPYDILPGGTLPSDILPCDILPCDNAMYSKYDFFILYTLGFMYIYLKKNMYCLAIICKILPCDIENLSPFG